jgi:hypothetical protein
MQWSDLPLNPSRRVLRQFAGLCILFFGGMAAWQYTVHDRQTLALILAAAAVIIGPLGLIAPAAVKPIFIAWLTLAFPIGWVVSRVLVALLFWAVMVPVGFVSRLAGRDVLQRQRRADRSSYWTPKPRPGGLHTYFRQY